MTQREAACQALFLGLLGDVSNVIAVVEESINEDAEGSGDLVPKLSAASALLHQVMAACDYAAVWLDKGPLAEPVFGPAYQTFSVPVCDALRKLHCANDPRIVPQATPAAAEVRQ